MAISILVKGFGVIASDCKMSGLFVDKFHIAVMCWKVTIIPVHCIWNVPYWYWLWEGLFVFLSLLANILRFAPIMDLFCLEIDSVLLSQWISLAYQKEVHAIHDGLPLLANRIGNEYIISSFLLANWTHVCLIIGSIFITCMQIVYFDFLPTLSWCTFLINLCFDAWCIFTMSFTVYSLFQLLWNNTKYNLYRMTLIMYNKWTTLFIHVQFCWCQQTATSLFCMSS